MSPSRAWSVVGGTDVRSSAWLLAAGLTAVVIPALAVVGGHLGAMLLGHTTREVGVQRAAIGLVSVVGGALVMAPALSLALLSLARSSRAEIGTRAACVAAMGLVWPVWACGAVLAIPPLLGLGPEPGELAWGVLAIAVTARTVRGATSAWLEIRRRWAGRFLIRTTVVVALLFAAIPVAPAHVARAAMGVSSKAAPPPLAPVSLPLPTAPSW